MPNNNDPPSTGRNNAPAAATNRFDDSFPTAANNANGLPEGNTNANTNQPTRAQTRAISRFQAAAERRNHRERSINKGAWPSLSRGGGENVRQGGEHSNLWTR